MNTESCFQCILKIEEEIAKLPPRDLDYRSYDQHEGADREIHNLAVQMSSALDENDRHRVLAEFEAYGPLEKILLDQDITEIIVNGPDAIWIERQGQLERYFDRFASEISYARFVNRLCMEAGVHYDLERPMVDGKFRGFRLHLLSQELTRAHAVMCLRRHPDNPWTFERLLAYDWGNADQVQAIENLLKNRENFLVIGGTGSGKTSLLNACLQRLSPQERAIVIEDTQELNIPNRASTRLLTRKDNHGLLPAIDQMELVRQSLRMRPDRIVMGEIRGAEAKDLLMALSTGHSGSFATLHANDANQALLRLEMLIQLGAPFWSIEAIRSLIFLSLQKIVVVGRSQNGRRELQGIYALSSREASGILIERVA